MDLGPALRPRHNCQRAANQFGALALLALLGPLNPVRSGDEVTLFVVRHGAGAHPHQPRL